MARIKHPHPQPGRVRDRIGGIEFIDGYADVDLSDKPNLADAYAMHGYEIEPEVAETATISDTAVSDHEPDESLDSLTVSELKALADDAGIKAKAKWSKADYVEALANHLETVIGSAETVEIRVNRDTFSVPKGKPITVEQFRTMAGVGDDFDVWEVNPIGSDLKLDAGYTPTDDGRAFLTSPRIINGN